VNQERYSYYFPSEAGLKTFSFNVRNQGEVSVVCRPYISGNVQFFVIADDREQTEFIVRPGEQTAFHVVILSAGLSTSELETSLLVDIEQIQGG